MSHPTCLSTRASPTPQEEIGLVTHKRQMDALALLCKKGGMVTPLFHILMAGMGGREGART